MSDDEYSINNLKFPLADLFDSLQDPSKTDEEIEEIHKELASYYVKNPKPFNDFKKMGTNIYDEGFKKYLIPGCANLQYSHDGVVFYYDEKERKLWCYGPKDWAKISHVTKTKGKEYNPYTLANSEREFSDRELAVKSVTLNKSSHENIKFWTEYTFTLGNVFYKVPEGVANEYAKTLVKNKSYLLYRGMSFKDKKDYSRYLHQIKANELDSKGIAKFETYTSWSYSKTIAINFSKHFSHDTGYGIVFYKYFKPEELLVDITKIKNHLYFASEQEVVALPFKGEVFIEEYISNNNNNEYIYYNRRDYEKSLLDSPNSGSPKENNYTAIQYDIEDDEHAEALDITLLVNGVKKEISVLFFDYLDLSSKNITGFLKETKFHENIINLALSNNQIKTTKNLVLPPNLKELNMRANQINDIDGLLLPESLKELDFCANKLENIDDLVLPEYLRNLNISQNKIKSIDGLVLPENLQNLNISDNEFTDLPTVNLPVDLLYLYASINKIKTLGYLPGNLLKLDVSKNKITRINKAKFPDTLAILDLSYNEIETLDDVVFPPNIVELYLQGNKIKKLGNVVFPKKFFKLAISSEHFEGDEKNILSELDADVFYLN